MTECAFHPLHFAARIVHSASEGTLQGNSVHLRGVTVHVLVSIHIPPRTRISIRSHRLLRVHKGSIEDAFFLSAGTMSSEPLPLSTFESLVLRSPPHLVNHLMACISSVDVGKLGLLNSRLRFWYHGYRKKTWDLVRFVRQYLRRPTYFLSQMDGRNALIYGESVLRFFLRCKVTKECAMDVCVTISKVYDLHRALIEDGYTNHDGISGLFTRSTLSEMVTNAVSRSTRRDYSSWLLTGDRSCEPEAHAGFKFRYRRKSTGMRINLVLVRCEPYRHVLANYISTFCAFLSLSCTKVPILPSGADTFFDSSPDVLYDA